MVNKFIIIGFMIAIKRGNDLVLKLKIVLRRVYLKEISYYLIKSVNNNQDLQRGVGSDHKFL